MLIGHDFLRPQLYLRKHRRRFLICQTIPLKLRPYFAGKTRLVASAETHSEIEAKAKGRRLAVEWGEQIEAAGAFKGTPEEFLAAQRGKMSQRPW